MRAGWRFFTASREAPPSEFGHDPASSHHVMVDLSLPADRVAVAQLQRDDEAREVGHRRSHAASRGISE